MSFFPSRNQAVNDGRVRRARLVQWRMQRLLTAGFVADLAQRLADDDQIDLHALLELVDRGCPPPLAARILSPLDERPEHP